MQTAAPLATLPPGAPMSPRLVPFDQVATIWPEVFPSRESANWFYRQHSAELVKLGAVLMPAGRRLIDPALFDQAIRTIGRRVAAQRQARPA